MFTPAQIISLEVTTAILIASAVCSGLFALGGVFLTAYVTALVRIVRLETTVDNFKRNVNDLGTMFRNFIKSKGDEK